MGRKPKPIGESISIVGFKVNKPETVDSLKTIAKREGVLLREIYNRAFEEYASRHGPGNYQTLIGSFQPGGIKSGGQIEQEITNELISKFPFHELKYIDIIKRCRSRDLKKDTSNTADRVAQELSKKGWKVWR